MATDLRALSIWWEDRGGWDSIPTVETHYSYHDDGVYACVWPGCPFTRRDAVAVWKHVHFAPKHRPKTSPTLAELTAQFDGDR